MSSLRRVNLEISAVETGDHFIVAPVQLLDCRGESFPIQLSALHLPVKQGALAIVPAIGIEVVGHRTKARPYKSQPDKYDTCQLTPPGLRPMLLHVR